MQPPHRILFFYVQTLHTKNPTNPIPKVFLHIRVTFHFIFLKASFIVLSRIVAYLLVCKVVV